MPAGNQRIEINDTNPKLLFGMNLLSLIIHFTNFIGLVILLVINDDTFRNTKLPITRINSKLNINNKIDLGIENLFTIRISILNISYFIFASFSHLLILLSWNKWIRNEKNKYNAHRWIEYSITSSIMMVIIAFYAHIYDLNTILFIIVSNATMILTGYYMEITEDNKDSMRYFLLGCILATIEWIIVFINLYKTDDVDLMNIIIIISVFILFCTFPLNAFLYYGKIGWWKRYDTLEVTYQIISFLTKSVLGWLSYSLLINWNKNEGICII